jgi:sugar transferase (PEP-CTERM system associated)
MTPPAPFANPANRLGPRLSAAAALLLLDFGVAFLAWPFAVTAVVRDQSPVDHPGALPLLLYPAGWLLFLYALGFYRRDALLDPRRALGRLPLAAAFGALFAAAGGTLLPLGPAGNAPALVAAAIIGFSAAGAVSRGVLAALRHLGVFRRRVLVVGAGRRAWDLAWLLYKEGRTLTYDLAYVHDPAMGEIDPRIAADPTALVIPAADGFLAAARRFGADQIVVAPDERRGLGMEALLACRTSGYPVSEYLRFLEREIGRVDIKRLEFSWLLYADGFDANLLDRALKRFIDIAASCLLLLLAGPFLLAAALAVRLEDGGPALYFQDRLTRDGRVFRILKLRTMRLDAERSGATWAAERDPRITRIGHFLRRTRLDELPQLINVLRGDMSFVGPRPERPEFTRKLAAQLPLYDERHRVRAGLTGWAQVNYPYGASLDDARSKLSYDLYYVKNYGVLFDLLIILQTLRVVLWPGGGAR